MTESRPASAETGTITEEQSPRAHSARPKRLSKHRTHFGAKTQWHAKWAAEKQELKLAYASDYERRSQDLYALLEKLKKTLNRLHQEATTKEDALARRLKQHDDTDFVEATVVNDNQNLVLRQTAMARDVREAERTQVGARRQSQKAV